MKLFILLACLAGALAFSVEDIDFENLVPIYETAEWKAAHPFEAKLSAFIESSPKLMSNERRGRIHNGTQARPGQIPYQAGIVILLSQQAFCGGSIISNNFILSAASCFPGDPNSVVEIGSVDRNTMSEFINVAQKIIHPAFDASNSQNDIALLRLVRSITFGPNIRAVRLPNRRQVSSTFVNQLARISGWGTADRILQFAEARVISQFTCQIRFPISASSNTLCIDGSTTGICAGDFGGPMAITDADDITTQIGISSFNAPLWGCTGGWPAGFTRIPMYLEWIGTNSDVVIRDGFDV